MNPLYESRQKDLQERWIKKLQGLNAYWTHDGNLKRPFAELTTGLISNFYANCVEITSRPDVCAEAVEDLLNLYPVDLPQRPNAIIGSAYGGITLAYEFARQTNAEQAWYTVKGEGKSLGLDRFEFTPKIRSVMMCDDVTSTFSTGLMTADILRAKSQKSGGNILPVVYTIVNRSREREIGGFRIVSLIEMKTSREWKRGSNPFVGGNERVEPIRPKDHWYTLTREYA